MTITFKLVFLVILAFVLIISLLTVLFGTVSWLIERFGWKAYTFLGILLLGVGYIAYSNFGDMIGKILTIIQ